MNHGNIEAINQLHIEHNRLLLLFPGVVAGKFFAIIIIMSMTTTNYYYIIRVNFTIYDFQIMNSPVHSTYFK